MIVADASVIVEFLVSGPESDRVERVRAIDPMWIAPPFWRAECINAVWKKLVNARLERARAFDAVERLEAFISFTPVSNSPVEVLQLALLNRHSPYDCEYVMLARQMSVKLLTLDGGVLEKFRDVAISPFAFCQRAAELGHD